MSFEDSESGRADNISIVSNKTFKEKIVSSQAQNRGELVSKCTSTVKKYVSRSQ